MNRSAMFCGALLLAGMPALAQPATTVNDYSAADRMRAEKAARAAGFAPQAVVMAQAGHLFLKAEKDGQTYMLTVTPAGKVYAGTGTPSSVSAM
jgi:hypothetical protein